MDLNGKVIVLVGGSGFAGRHIAQALLARGARLRVASRHPEHAMALKPLANLGQVQLARCDVTIPASLRTVLNGADGVVNLVGCFTGDLDAVMHRGAGAVAATAKAAGASCFVHISAIGADLQGSTDYAVSKAAGEMAVLAAFPGATILRPSALFGPDDNFVNMLAGFSGLPVLPVFAPQARMQPLFVDDLATAVANALADHSIHGGKTFELGGPEVITMADLQQRIAKAAGRSPAFVELPDVVSEAIATLTGWLPGAPLSRQQWKLLKAGNTASGAYPGCAELGVNPRPLSLFIDKWLVRFRKHGRFANRAAA